MGKKKSVNKGKKQVVKQVDPDAPVMIEENRSGERPFVSVICPTYNRRRFLPNVIHQFLNQTYPQEFMELIILDDSDEPNHDIIPNRSNIKYTYVEEHMMLGKKRNVLNSMTTGDIVIAQDDDDFYGLDRVSSAVSSLLASPALLAGSSVIHIYYKHIDKILEFGPYAKFHGTNGTFAYKKEFLKDHHYEDDAVKAEESFLTNGFTTPMVQLNPHKLMLCLAHNCNTVEKQQFLAQGRVTGYTLKNFFKHKDKYMIDWIKNEL
mgnify:CR=1 FL=1